LKKIGKILFTVFTLLFISLQVFAATLKFDATVDQNKLTVDDSFTLTLTLTSDSGVNDDEPTLPDLSGFEVLNKWTQSEANSVYVNGKFQFLRKQSYKYTLQPQKTGVLVLGPAEITVKGQKLNSSPIKITVLAAGAMPPNSNVARGGRGGGRNQGVGRGNQNPSDDDEALNPFAGFDDDDDGFAQLLKRRGLLPNGNGGIKSAPLNDRDAFFLQVEVNKSKVYVGEEILASWYLYTKGSVQSFDSLKFPDLKGFIKEDLEIASRLNMQSAVVNGMPYNKALLVSYALFPINAGKKVIDPYKAKATVIEMNTAMSVFGMGRPYTFEKVSKEIPIEVMPLPTAGKPDSFSGAVGNFHVTGSLNTTQVKANQPFSLKIRFQGVGNVRNIELPPLNFPKELEVYDTKKESQFLKTGEGYKEFEVLLIPRTVGDLKIPPISVSYFDPKTAKYVSQNTPAFQIKVLPGDPGSASPQNLPMTNNAEPSTIQPVTKDIKYLKTAPLFDVAPRTRKLFWFTIFSALVLGFGIALWKLYQFDPHDLTDVVKKRVREKMKVAREKLKQGDAKGVGVECGNAVIASLAEITGSGLSLPTPDLLKRLPKGSESFQGEIEKFLSFCEIVSFAPVELSGIQSEIKDLKGLVHKTETLVAKIFAINK
jgi:hypothetical protein